MSEESYPDTPRAYMESIRGKEFPVLDKGFVRLVDWMGDDLAVVQAARVSTGSGIKTPKEDRGLIRYLLRNRHTSPFEQCVLKLHMKMPIFVARQWVRHRMASLNEVSGRYTELADEFFIPSPEEVCVQSGMNKQGSAAAVDPSVGKAFAERIGALQHVAYNDYQNALEQGIAKEMARINLPLSLYTEWYWKCDLHNLMHLMGLRSDSHAQKEIRAYSDTILNEIVRHWVPWSHEAFLDYRLNAFNLSAQMLQIVRELIQCEGPAPWDLISAREKDELAKALSIPIPAKEVAS